MNMNLESAFKIWTYFIVNFYIFVYSQLRSYEAHLATIALSSVEASRTIAQVLYDMNNIWET